MTTVRVIKVGGSLLDWPLLGEALWEWLQHQPAAANYLLTGGGALADALRAADATHRLGDELCHDLCLQVMGITSSIVEKLFADAQLRPGATRDQQRRTTFLDVRALLHDASFTTRIAHGLPQTWDVTSDSIAAYLADGLQAHELVLLKTAPLPCSMTFREASTLRYVDNYFCLAAAPVAKVRAVQLKATERPEWLLFP